MMTIISILSIVLIKLFIIYGTSEIIKINVIGTDKIIVKENNWTYHKYLVITDNETFENNDCSWYLKWNSYDIQGNFMRNGMHTVRVYGLRIPFISPYRNIVEIIPQGTMD